MENYYLYPFLEIENEHTLELKIDSFLCRLIIDLILILFKILLATISQIANKYGKFLSKFRFIILRQTDLENLL